MSRKSDQIAEHNRRMAESQQRSTSATAEKKTVRVPSTRGAEIGRGR